MYLKWNSKTISDFSDDNINTLYGDGFLFTRTGKGELYQTRSLRINLSKFADKRGINWNDLTSVNFFAPNFILARFKTEFSTISFYFATDA